MSAQSHSPAGRRAQLKQFPVVLQLSSMVPPARYGGAERVVGSFGQQLEQAGFRVHNRGLKPRDPASMASLDTRFETFSGPSTIGDAALSTAPFGTPLTPSRCRPEKSSGNI